MQNSFHVARRAVLSGLLAVSLVPVLPGISFALDKAESQALIEKITRDILKIINSSKSERQMFAEFEKVFSKYSDVPIIAKSSLGVAWRSASASQRAAYVKAFRGYISRKYGKRFREFEGARFEVIGSKPVKRGYLVTSNAFLKGHDPFVVEWQVSDASGKNLMFNLYIEGINMLSSERTEIGAMLDKQRGDVNKLITALKKAG